MTIHPPSRDLRILLSDRPTEVSRELVQNQLFVGVAVDRGGTPEPVTYEELDGMQISPPRALELAMNNLRRVSAAGDLRPVDALPGLLVLRVSDGQAASRLAVLPELIDPMPFGGVVAAVPEPGQLLCVPMDSVRAIDALQALASAVGHAEATRDRLLSDQLFWFDGHRWRPILVEHGDEDITVLPPPDFLEMMGRVASMDLVRVAGEA